MSPTLSLVQLGSISKMAERAYAYMMVDERGGAVQCYVHPHDLCDPEAYGIRPLVPPEDQDFQKLLVDMSQKPFTKSGNTYSQFDCSPDLRVSYNHRF